jgi:ERF superfamily
MADAKKFEYPEDTPAPTQKPVESPVIATVRHSNELGELARALAKAQLEFTPIVKSVENTFYTTERKKAMYADLAGIIAATQKALAQNGLVIIQSPLVLFEEKRAGSRSRLLHESGEWMECEVLLPATAKAQEWKDNVKVPYQKFDAQTCGIAITYSRRYAYQSLIGVAAEEDDDANGIGEPSGGSVEAAKAVANRKIAEFEAKKGKKAETPEPGDKYADVKASLSDCKNADDLNFLLEGWRGDKALVSDPNVRAFVHSRAKALNLIFDDSSGLWVPGVK